MDLRDMNNRIREKQEKIDSLRAALTSTSMTFGEKVQTSPTDRISKLMCEILTLEDELTLMIDDYADRKRELQTRILSLKNEEWKDILYMRHIEFESWKEIARKKNTKVNYVIQKGKRAKKFLDNT